MTRRAAVLSLGFFLVGCKTDGYYLNQARDFVTRGCCEATGVDSCERCDLVRGARIVREEIEDDCGNTCKHVTLQIRGPAGQARCELWITPNGTWASQGGCHSIEELTPQRR